MLASLLILSLFMSCNENVDTAFVFVIISFISYKHKSLFSQKFAEITSCNHMEVISTFSFSSKIMNYISRLFCLFFLTFYSLTLISYLFVNNYCLGYEKYLLHLLSLIVIVFFFLKQKSKFSISIVFSCLTNKIIVSLGEGSGLLGMNL